MFPQRPMRDNQDLLQPHFSPASPANIPKRSPHQTQLDLPGIIFTIGTKPGVAIIQHQSPTLLRPTPLNPCFPYFMKIK